MFGPPKLPFFNSFENQACQRSKKEHHPHWKKIPPMLSDFLTAVNATKILTFLRKGPILDQAQQLLPNVGNSSPCNKVVETWKHLKVIRRRTSACRRRFLECSFCCVFCHHYHYHKRKHAIPPQTLTLSL